MDERRSMVIDGRTHVEHDDGYFHRLPLGMDEARSAKGQQWPKYHVGDDGVPYEAVDAKKYSDGLMTQGSPTITAEKSGYVLARKAVEGEKLAVHAGDGKQEAVETGREGCYILTKADVYGRPVLNKDGQENSWQVTEDVFRKKYDVPEGGIEGTAFVKPAGGPQKFVEVDRNVSIEVPWGPGGSMVPLDVEKGGKLNVTDPSDIYGVSGKDFSDTYAETGRSLEGQAKAIFHDFGVASTQRGDVDRMQGTGFGNVRAIQELEDRMSDDVGKLSALRSAGHVPADLAAKMDDDLGFQKRLSELADGTIGRAGRAGVETIERQVAEFGDGPYAKEDVGTQIAKGHEALTESALSDYAAASNLSMMAMGSISDNLFDSYSAKREYLVSAGVDVDAKSRQMDQEAQARMAAIRKEDREHPGARLERALDQLKADEERQSSGRIRGDAQASRSRGADAEARFGDLLGGMSQDGQEYGV